MKHFIFPLLQYHGINVKSCYCDFDRHHHGLVTQSQVRALFQSAMMFTCSSDAGLMLAINGQNVSSCLFCSSTCLVFLQFHRSFPGPPDVTSAEVDTLAHRYFDPTTGLYNYLQFHNDILTIGAGGTTATVTLTPQLPSIPVS